MATLLFWFKIGLWTPLEYGISYAEEFFEIRQGVTTSGVKLKKCTKCIVKVTHFTIKLVKRKISKIGKKYPRES